MAESKTETGAAAAHGSDPGRPGPLDVLLRVDVLSGLMFVGIGVLGLYLSRNLDLGTAARMGTAYMPRLCCFALIGLGAVIMAGGLLATGEGRVGGGQPISWRSLILVPAAVFAFGYTVEKIGLVLAILLAVGIASTAAAGQRPLGIAVAAVALVAMCVSIFVWGLGLPFSIWIPDH